MSVVTNLLKSLGFTLNQKKCILSPSQSPEFLGFQEDTITMTQTTEDLEEMSLLFLDAKDLSKITGLGLMTSTSPAFLNIIDIII